MDDIAGILKREIVLDCLEGTTLAQLWSYVEKAHREVVAMRGLDSGPIVVDEALKNYLWPYILQLKDILFVEGETIIYNAADLGASADPEFSQQSAAQVEEKYPELHVRGTLAAINKELFGREEGSKKIMSSPMASKIIQLLARSRGEGVTQAQLSKDLSIDPRSMYHFVKLLDFEGLVVKLAAFRKGCSTNLIVLRRFANEIPEPSISSTKEDNSGNAQGGSEPGSSITKKSMPDGEYSLTNTLVRIGVRSKITDILGKREHGLMVEYDVMDEISLDYWDVSQRKYFFRVVRDMVEAGYIKRVRAQVKDLHSSLDGEPSIDDDAVVLDGSDAEIEADAADSNADADADVQMDLEATDTDGKPESKGKDDDVIDNKRKRALTEKERREKRKVVERRRQGLRDGYNFKRCLQLVKPYKTKTRIHKKLGIPNQSINNDGMMMMDENGASINEGEDEDEDEEDNDKDEDDFTDEEELSIEDLKEREDLRLLFSNDILSAGLGASLGIDMQVFRLIALTGTYGTVARAIQHTLGEPNFKLIARMLTRLEAMHVYDANNMIPGVFFDPAAQNVSGFMISIRLHRLV
ncbi:hypothetical protein GGI07_004470 [Coemansia sp. Benny D115]|nr:hypothetical protein GGI07_004470 [Coemansia sp. Benny D115]